MYRSSDVGRTGFWGKGAQLRDEVWCKVCWAWLLSLSVANCMCCIRYFGYKLSMGQSPSLPSTHAGWKPNHEHVVPGFVAMLSNCPWANTTLRLCISFNSVFGSGWLEDAFWESSGLASWSGGNRGNIYAHNAVCISSLWSSCFNHWDCPFSEVQNLRFCVVRAVRQLMPISGKDWEVTELLKHLEIPPRCVWKHKVFQTRLLLVD